MCNAPVGLIFCVCDFMLVVLIKRFIFFVMLMALAASGAVPALAYPVTGAKSDPPRRDASRLAVDLTRYEGRVVAAVEVVIEEAAVDAAVEAEFRSLLRLAPGRRFSSVLVRESLQALFDSERVANVRVEAFEASGGTRPGQESRPVNLRFHIRPQVLVNEVVINLSATPAGAVISEDELRARLNLLEPGKRASSQAIANNADAIQVYLRDRGFYRANVESAQQLDATKTRATIIYRVTPGERATVSNFQIKITGFDEAPVRPSLALQPGAPFTQAALGEDIARLRRAIIALGYLAPRINEAEARTVLDSTGNTISIEVTGAVGPKVDIVIKGYDDLSEKQARELLPIKREGTLDWSAIVEGERRLENHLQEQGFFFVDATPSCTITPPLTAPNHLAAADGRHLSVCEMINPEELGGRSLQVVYDIDPGRRFKLTDIRIEGTDKITLEDVANDLRTREANALGFIPLIGLGRGYTSAEALAQDERTIAARMRDLGYRGAVVTQRQGVSPEGENLIITFVVNEGTLTRVAGIEVRGNQIFTTERLRDAACPADRLPDEFCNIVESPYSRSTARAEADRLRSFYARHGYLDAEVALDVVDLPEKSGDQQVRLIYTVKEAEKVFINRIIINGNALTEREAITKSIPLRPGDVLRAENIVESERILYGTDAFRQVLIRSEQAGETASGFKRRDIFIDVEEKQRYVMDYGGGFSTDSGPLGLFEIRNSNLFGQLRQGAFRSRVSRRQQLARLEYFDPRFRRYGERAFAPLVISAQYQRDTSVTRFFRSRIDRGNSGIVQRLNEKGEPIDVNCFLTPDSACEPISEPTINRFTVNIETQRDIELELGPQGRVRKRSTLFLRYNYEDVRLFNTGSLLIASILRPDRAVRLSRFGASFARDTRDSSFDATRGDFLSLDYALALKQLGGNISFGKFLANYRRYYQLPRLRGLVLAAGLQFGLASLYDPTDRDGVNGIDDADRRLPISERFFSGGSTTLRGFGAEEAGPRLLVKPTGMFRDSEGQLITIDPFTVPIGGNALAVVNLEARIPITKSIQAVPFYDGGNVFPHIKDIFKPSSESSTDPNQRARWTHTVGLGFRVKTPLGPLSVDYGYLLNPPEFLLSDPGVDPPGIFRLSRGRFHFRFGQTF